MKMKMVSLITLVFIVIVTSVVVISMMISNQRENDDILAQVVVWPGGGGARSGLPIYYFVIKNDGTLIGRYGLSRSYTHDTRTRNFIRSTTVREQLVLSDEDFIYISGLINKITLYSEEHNDVFGSSHVMFIQNGTFYNNSSTRSGSLQQLLRTLFRLTAIESNDF